MIQKFAAKVLSFYEVRNTRVTEYLLIIYNTQSILYSI